jgi:glucose/arabinose dehydrogenase
MHVSRLSIVLCCLAAVACDKRSPPAPPVVTPPSETETINGTERIGWDQRAADAVELAAIGYVLYVDGTRTPLTAVACATDASAAGFGCNARLPALSAGSHTLQIASFVTDGTVLESERSASLSVTVVPQTNAGLKPRTTTTTTPPSQVWSGTLVETLDHVKLRVELVVEGLEEPTDLVFAPDGRLLVAERAGAIRILPREAGPSGPGDSGNTSVQDPALSLADDSADGGTTLLALAVDPQFERTRFVFALYTAPSRSGEPMFTLARFRESSNTLGDRIVLLDGVRASSPSPAAALRFGADGKLYAAFDDGGDPRRSGDRGSLNGKVARLNPDGTTPDDQASSTPVYSEGYRSPGGFDWDPPSASGTLWVVDRGAGASSVRGVVPDPASRAGEKRGVVRGAYMLPAASVPASVAFYRGHLFPAFAGSLLIASNEGRHLLRISRDPGPGDGGADRRFERLLQDRVGGVRAVAVAPDGVIYFANATAIGRLVPDAP